MSVTTDKQRLHQRRETPDQHAKHDRVLHTNHEAVATKAKDTPPLAAADPKKTQCLGTHLIKQVQGLRAATCKKLIKETEDVLSRRTVFIAWETQQSKGVDSPKIDLEF